MCLGDQVLRLEPVQRLPHRGLGDPEPAAEHVDRDPFTGLDVSVQQEFQQSFVDDVAHPGASWTPGGTLDRALAHMFPSGSGEFVYTSHCESYPI
jgi:hypothetical protein